MTIQFVNWVLQLAKSQYVSPNEGSGISGRQTFGFALFEVSLTITAFDSVLNEINKNDYRWDQ